MGQGWIGRLDILEAKVLENTWREGGKKTGMYSCIIESFRYPTLVVDHPTSNSSDPHLYSLSEMRATIILRIRHRVSARSFIQILIRVNVPVEIVEERQQVEPELDETLLLVPGQRPEDFRCVIHVVFIADPVGMKRSHSG